jgi:Patatin-like phospholipase
MVDVARATSAAPIFLEAVEQSGYALIDGGLFANNPIMVALVDALACYDVPRDRVRILSLGCLKDSWTLKKVQGLGSGWLAWGYSMYSVTSSLQSQNAHGQASLLIGAQNILRIDAPQPSHPIRLDDWVRAKAELPPIADRLVGEHSTTALEVFFKEPVHPYEPTYTPAMPPN